ncbi:pentapeptide repeat-containing protein [Kineosporia succinea]|uniref:Uncharacterized protein YjbI with pentapeptide repeats n=1 Tax=Kineosporia succinea TaxID=84632 RepID=A0ABT9P0Y7_9ACTN|nr:pentapeptide repeat-containing protein [Kineosporia succinea]MDP9826338.1 uncharacterized protein YjbI with pentapeptide repeats [Kineosporia succinea]
MAAIGLALAASLWLFPQYVTGRGAGLSEVQRLTLANDARMPALVAVAVGAGVAGLWFSVRQQQRARTVDRGERFNRAVTQLTDPAASTRVGAVYALERLSHERGQDTQPVAEVLAAFVQEARPLEVTGHFTAISSDVAAALQVLARVAGHRRRPVDLTAARLPGGQFKGIDLSGANLALVDLSGADLSLANLANCNLSHADLRGADLSWANLLGADLTGADTRDCDMRQVSLTSRQRAQLLEVPAETVRPPGRRQAAR